MKFSIRSTLFNAVFFSAMFLSLALGRIIIPIIGDKYIFKFWNLLSRLLNFLTCNIMKITYTIENENNLPKKEAAILAIRHESTWETLMLTHDLKEPIFVLKKELLNIPLFGYLAEKARSIPIDRDNGMKSLTEAARAVEKAIAEGHHVVIFPEGTRVGSGQHAELKRGISFFYKRNKCPIVPIVHDSGKFWPRRSFVKKSGNISVIVCDPIKPGLSSDDFMEKLNSVFYEKIEKLKQNATGTDSE